MASDIENGNHAPLEMDARASMESAQPEGSFCDHDLDHEWIRMKYEAAASIKTRIRIMDATRHARRINTGRTLASKLLGRGSETEALLFQLSVKDKWPSRILWTLWWIGAVCGMLSLVRIGPDYGVFLSIFMLPLPFFALSVISLDLVSEVLKGFECYFITGMQLILLGGSIHLLRDRRVVFWVCYLPTMLCASFVDAYPAKFRSIFSKLFFTSMGCVYLVWLAMLFSGWLNPVYDRTWHAGELSGKAVSSIAQNTTTLLAFCVRQLACAILTPNNFVLIVSPVRTSRIYVEPEMEVVDGEWKPTGKFVRDIRATRLEMAAEEMAKVSNNVATRSTSCPVMPSQRPSNFKPLEMGEPGRRAREMAVQTDVTIPLDHEKQLSMSKLRPLLEDVENIQILMLPKSQQVPKPAADQPLAFPNLRSGAQGMQPSIFAATFLEHRNWVQQDPGVSESIRCSASKCSKPMNAVAPHNLHNHHNDHQHRHDHHGHYDEKHRGNYRNAKEDRNRDNQGPARGLPGAERDRHEKKLRRDRL